MTNTYCAQVSTLPSRVCICITYKVTWTMVLYYLKLAIKSFMIPAMWDNAIDETRESKLYINEFGATN